MPELKISLRRIAEDGFTKNDEILADTSKTLMPRMGFELMSDIKKSADHSYTGRLYHSGKRNRSFPAFPLYTRGCQPELTGVCKQSGKRNSRL